MANDINIDDREAFNLEAEKVREKHVELTKAVDNYHKMLKSIGI